MPGGCVPRPRSSVTSTPPPTHPVQGEAMNDEVRHGVAPTNLEQPLFDDADTTKPNLLDYLDALGDCMIPQLRHPLSVVRVLRGQAPFIQQNISKHAPEHTVGHPRPRPPCDPLDRTGAQVQLAFLQYGEPT
jgi:hypothetical protein